MDAFQAGDLWLTYEQGPLHEYRSDVIQEVDVIMPELELETPFVAGEIQKYVSREGKMLWRSLTPKRDIFRSGYVKRERCAQELLRDCPAVVERIGWRRNKMVHRQ